MLMEEVPGSRIEAARKFARLMTTEAGRRRLADIGTPPGTPAVPADSNEAIVDVFDRIMAHGDGPALLAVHFADRPGEDALILATWWGVAPAGGHRPEQAPPEAESVTFDGGVDAGGGATIGMLIDSLDNGRGLDRSLRGLADKMAVYAP